MPIIAPIKHKKVEVLEKDALQTHYSNEFLTGLLNSSADVTRNIAVVGHLHHGKTSVRQMNRSCNGLVSEVRGRIEAQEMSRCSWTPWWC